MSSEDYKTYTTTIHTTFKFSLNVQEKFRFALHDIPGVNNKPLVSGDAHLALSHLQGSH